MIFLLCPKARFVAFGRHYTPQWRTPRFLAQLSVGPMPHDRILRSIELFGTAVAPAVRQEIARRSGL